MLGGCLAKGRPAPSERAEPPPVVSCPGPNASCAAAGVLSVVTRFRFAGLVVVAVAGEQISGQESYDHDGRANSAYRPQVDGRNAHEHSDDVGHKPYQPNDRAERVEALSRLLAAAKIGDGGPHRMHDHERDSKRACDAVDAEAGHIRLAGDVTHDEGARCVAGQAGPKQEDIFQAERSVATLAEYAPRVKKQGQGDGHGGDDELDRHEIPFVDGAPAFMLAPAMWTNSCCVRRRTTNRTTDARNVSFF